MKIRGACFGAVLVCTALVLVGALGGHARNPRAQPSSGASSRNADAASAASVRVTSGSVSRLNGGSVVRATAGPSRFSKPRQLKGSVPAPRRVVRTDEVEQHVVPRIPVDRNARIRHGKPIVAPIRLRSYRPAAVNIFKATDLRPVADAALGEASLTNEPSIAQNGNTVLQTWNWGAATSKDAGATWSYMDPVGDDAGDPLPARDDGFCCDQLAYYIPGSDLYVWILQYIEGATTGENAIRVAVAKGATALENRQFAYWDLTPKQVNAAWSGVMYYFFYL